MKKFAKRLLGVALCLVCMMTVMLESNLSIDTVSAANSNIMKKPYYESYLAKDRTFMNKIYKVSLEWSNGYGFAKDWNAYAKYLQKKIKTVEDLMFWIKSSRYHYAEIEGLMGYVRNGWSVSGDPRIDVAVGFGVCCETSNLVSYLLDGDYDEIGYVLVTGDHGHQYNYIKDNGTYYFIDFTDFTSNPMYADEEEIWNNWKDKICFASDKKLDSDYMKKAACIHDTYADGNTRKNYDISWQREHTAAIVAIKSYGAKCGYVPPSTYRDDCYQWLDQGVKVNGKTYYLNTVKMGFQKEVFKNVKPLYLNNDYMGAKWELVSIPLKKIPWYCNTVGDKEDNMKKFLRQKDDMFCVQSKEVETGLFIRLMNLDHMHSSGINKTVYEMSPSELCKKFDLRTKY